jgi:hypothetical protein
MTYIPHRIRVPTHEADLCWGCGLLGEREWQPEEGERMREEERKKRRGRMRKKGVDDLCIIE